MTKTPHCFNGPKWVQNPTDFGTLPETKNSHLNIAWIVRFLSIFKWFHFRQVLHVWSFQAQWKLQRSSFTSHFAMVEMDWAYINVLLWSRKRWPWDQNSPPRAPRKFIPGIFLVWNIQTHRIESYIGDIVGCILNFHDKFKDLTMDMADWLVVSILYAQIPYVYKCINVCL